VFLSGSEVLRRPPEEIIAYLDVIGTTFAISPIVGRGADHRTEPDEAVPWIEGIHAFLDDFAPPSPDPIAWREFASRGLVRISVGVESGAAEVRAVYQKRWENDQLRAVVSDLKAAGLGVGLLTLVGAGGIERAESHVTETTQLIDSLALTRGDFVFLLDENEIRDPLITPEGLAILEGPAWDEQQNRLKEGLAPLRKRGVKVLPYTMEKQWA
jgi:hypothetical protein